MILFELVGFEHKGRPSKPDERSSCLSLSGVHFHRVLSAAKEEKESHMSRTLVKFVLGLAGCIFVLTFASSVAKAQFTSAIEGTVTDPTGALLHKASVTLKNMSTGAERTVETSDTGYYRISSLPAATFTVTVTANGFRTSMSVSCYRLKPACRNLRCFVVTL